MWMDRISYKNPVDIHRKFLVRIEKNAAQEGTTHRTPYIHNGYVDM